VSSLRQLRYYTSVSPGVGPVTASALLATVQDFGAFSTGREFAAFLGLAGHQLSDTYRLGITQRVDPNFLSYNNTYNNSGITITGASMASHQATYTFTQPTT
jgi:hypothetical protein